jgi:hypothetical protein
MLYSFEDFDFGMLVDLLDLIEDLMMEVEELLVVVVLEVVELLVEDLFDLLLEFQVFDLDEDSYMYIVFEVHLIVYFFSLIYLYSFFFLILLLLYVYVHVLQEVGIYVEYLLLWNYLFYYYDSFLI